MLQNLWLEHDFACLETDHYAGMEENGWCHSMEMILVYASLATIDGFIALAAAIQLLRLYVHNRHASWTRQKASSIYQPIHIHNFVTNIILLSSRPLVSLTKVRLLMNLPL
jgi:hypothetical protein